MTGHIHACLVFCPHDWMRHASDAVPNSMALEVTVLLHAGIISFLLLSIEEIGVQIEEPFGNLPMCAPTLSGSELGASFGCIKALQWLKRPLSIAHAASLISHRSKGGSFSRDFACW